LPPLSEELSLAAVLIVGIAAASIDLRTRRIPNLLTGLAATAGLVMATTGAGDLTVGRAVAGLAIGAAVMLPGHVFGATGAGDVKLMAAMGTLLGPGGIVMGFIYTAIAGGVLAMAYAAGRGRLTATVRGTARLVAAPAAGQREIVATRGNSFPYGPAIAIGCAIAALG
jgi:prepilin peptidase CpaA